MLDQKIEQIIGRSRLQGWVLEPDAKKIMTIAGMDVPEGVVTDDPSIAVAFMQKMAAPVVVKAVSADIVHKTEHRAVVTGIDDPKILESQMKRLMSLPGCNAVLIEEMVSGIEVIIGAKNDYQFGPVIVFGTGGTGVEIYNDTAIRMAPLKSGDVLSMVNSLKARQMISGYRGMPGVNMQVLTSLMVRFSNLVMGLESEMESIDLNPVICTADRCVIADARLLLAKPAA
jgi:succinyl-CoA synthetase beta subunit